ncbi:MAG: GntR family transcriptional regulator [Candidatus Hydrogenedentes bacterium]|nr:GntR family transcriptional regulator [Candidatus Hydrogenedentota bacterium]
MSKLPLYLKIKHDLKTAIDGGDLHEGARIPSEIELAAQYGVSRNPTRQALRELELEGYITRTRRRGSFVAPHAKRNNQLSMTQGRALAILCPNVRTVNVREIVNGFIQGVGERGFHAMVYFMECTDKRQSELLSDIRQSGLAGVALWLSDDCDETLAKLDYFRKINYPFVLFDRYVREREWDFVVTDNEYLTYTLTKALLAKGHRNIGFFISSQSNTANEDRKAGYQRALKEAGISNVEEFAAALDPDENNHTADISRIIARKERPSAIVCAQDWTAMKVSVELHRLGYAIPQDVVLASVDDGEIALHPDLEIVTAKQDTIEMGRMSADTLMRRVELPQIGPTQVFLKPSFHHEDLLGETHVALKQAMH